MCGDFRAAGGAYARRARIYRGRIGHGRGTLMTSPAAFSITPDGYKPPAKSLELVKGIRLDHAVRVGQKYGDQFKRWDNSSKGKSDPSMCPGIYRIGNDVLFFEAKMAIDADGSTTDSVLRSSSGADKHTSYQFAGDIGVNAEVVPYFVVPTFDNPARAKPGVPFEGSGDRFIADFNLKHGNLGVVIFEDRITGAILADEGPAMKIGEASVRVHELIRKRPAPWKGDPADRILKDASEAKGVLYFIFADTIFDINAFDAHDQWPMADAIQLAAMERFRGLTGQA